MLYQNERGYYYKVGNHIVYQGYKVNSQEDAEKLVKEMSDLKPGYTWNGPYTDSQPPNRYYY